MPNHVTTRCVVTGPADEIAKFSSMMFVDSDIKDRKVFDFNAAVPMPPQLFDVEEGGRSEEGVALILLRAERGVPFAAGGLRASQIKRIRDDVGMPDVHIQTVAMAYLAKHPEVEEAGKLRLKAIMETGFASWYPWSIHNWGTKWNSYEFELVSDEPLEFTFQTAWSFPFPIFNVLAATFPTLHFECSSYDEASNFACDGFFNPASEGKPFIHYDHNSIPDGLYKKVYGTEQPSYEE